MNARVPQSMLNAAQALDQISRQWDGDIVRQLSDYIAIPAKSPMFDAEWAQHGYLDTVVRNSWTLTARPERRTVLGFPDLGVPGGRALPVTMKRSDRRGAWCVFGGE